MWLCVSNGSGTQHYSTTCFTNQYIMFVFNDELKDWQFEARSWVTPSDIALPRDGSLLRHVVRSEHPFVHIKSCFRWPLVNLLYKLFPFVI